jgi:hypothetical protein
LEFILIKYEETEEAKGNWIKKGIIRRGAISGTEQRVGYLCVRACVRVFSSASPFKKQILVQEFVAWDT